VAPRNLDFKLLQKQLIEHGAQLSMAMGEEEGE
jgi:hypothetical protein